MNGSCDNEVVESRRSTHRHPTPLLQTRMMPPHKDAQLFSLSRILEYGIGGACFTALTGISAANTSRHGSQVVVCSMLDCRTSYEAALQIARRRILSVISDDVVFYLGITEHPDTGISTSSWWRLDQAASQPAWRSSYMLGLPERRRPQAALITCTCV